MNRLFTLANFAAAKAALKRGMDSLLTGVLLAFGYCVTIFLIMAYAEGPVPLYERYMRGTILQKIVPADSAQFEAMIVSDKALAYLSQEERGLLYRYIRSTLAQSRGIRDFVTVEEVIKYQRFLEDFWSQAPKPEIGDPVIGDFE